ncbi:MAG: methyltransferase domain-containing protein [Bacteroidales bacterium]|jgi:cyclopropane fatty-acyl-phospholipid synthase-like methyltransferase|nr:methyltransferase domain-containing protein [Bacteroidales bacterium]NLM92382.1 methyltransferase domain-containing protein [Bacteroidales bacterium]
MAKAFWDQRYAEDGFVYGPHPNLFFCKELGKLKPGRLLLPGEGEGRNAVYAARRGWEVVAFDQSSEGQRKALALAAQKQLSIEYLVCGVDAFEAEPESFDCLALIFVHFPSVERKGIHQKLISYLKPEGTLIMEVFSKEQLGRKSGGPQHRDMLYSEEELMEDFGLLKSAKILHLETELTEGRYHEGLASVIRLIGKK